MSYNAQTVICSFYGQNKVISFSADFDVLFGNAFTEFDSISSGAFAYFITAIAKIEDVGIVTGTAVKSIITHAAVKYVITLTAVDNIITFTCQDKIVTVVCFDNIITGFRNYRFVFTGTVQCIVIFRALY